MDFSQFDLTDPFVRRALAETLAEDNGLDYQDEYIRKALNDEIAAAAAPKPIDGERNFFGDTVSRLARGGVQLADTAIHAVDTAVGGSETLQGWSDSLDKAKQNVGLLRPDKSEHEEGWLKRSYGQALESAPMSAVPWAGAMAGAKAGAALGTMALPGAGTAAGMVAGGLVGGTLAMGGLFGLGTYGQRKEEVERELTATRPDLTPDEISKMAHDNAKNHAFAETGGESAGDLASWAILSKVPGGQAIFKGGKAVLAELVKPNAFKAIALGVGKSMPFEVGSEVGTAIWQNEADKAIGVEQGTSTDAALAAIGPAMFLSAGMGVAVGGYSANQRRVQYNALNSEDQESRAQAVDQVAGTLAEATDQQTAKKWRDMALGFVQNGQPIPLDMNLAELSANEPEVAAPEEQDQPAETILKAESVDEAIQEAEAEIAKPGWLARTVPDLEESAWLQQGVAAKAYNQGRNELGATPASRAGLLGQAMEPMQVAAPADPLTEVLSTISTADQPTLLQMADGLPGLVEGSPELAPYQRQLSEAISKRQRILWEESNVGRGKVSGDQGAVEAGGVPQPEQQQQPESAAGRGSGEVQVPSGQGEAEASPLLTAARQHVAETGDMTMGGMMKALDVDIDTAEKLLEQVRATTPLPRNIGGTRAATVGADTGGFLNDQAIRKAGATSPATTAGDAQGFIADQGIRNAAGAVTAAPVADTEGFVRDQQIRRDAMGRGPKPTRAADEPARAFLARKREWEKGVSQTGENETQAELPRTDETQAGAGKGVTAPSPGEASSAPAAQPSASKATPEKPVGVATSGQRQEQAAKEPWQMTREEYLADALERNEYRDQYKANPKLLPPFEENTEREWRRSVEKAAETDRIPDAVLDSYLEKFGKQVFASTFRGVAEKGVQGYFYPEIRAEQKAATTDKKTAIYDLKPHERAWAQQRGEERKAVGRMLTKAEWKELREQHKSAVQKALWNGEKVPASVLADYPELADAKPQELDWKREQASLELGAAWEEDADDFIRNHHRADTYGWRNKADAKRAYEKYSEVERGEPKVSFKKFSEFFDARIVERKDSFAQENIKKGHYIKRKQPGLGDRKVPWELVSTVSAEGVMVDNKTFVVPFDQITDIRTGMPELGRGEVIFKDGAPVVRKVSAQSPSEKDAETASSEAGESDVSPKSPKAPIADFGEKIGGARKDSAERGYTRSAGKEKKATGWRAQFQVAENTITPGEWMITDTKSTSRFGNVLPQKFASKEEAERAVPVYAVAKSFDVRVEDDGTFAIYKRVGDRKRLRMVQQSFATRDEAMRHMATNAEALLDAKTTFGEEILPVPEIATRKGPKRRSEDATPELFNETFAPRAIEFGNWNNQEERQQVLNHAYDGLLDLAEVLGVPPKALMLNGELAIAFGARGQGLVGAKAHYERNYGVINLTKMKGAGSLAHEWFHALDHYLARQDGKSERERKKNERGDMVYPASGPLYDYLSHGPSMRKSGVRPELQQAYDSLIDTMFKRAEQYVGDTEKAEKFVGAAKRHVLEQLDRIREDIAKDRSGDAAKNGGWKRSTRGLAPASAEQLAEFDRLADLLVEGGALELERRDNLTKEEQAKILEKASGRNRTAAVVKTMAWRNSNDALDGINSIYKAVRGRSGFSSGHDGFLDRIAGSLENYAARLKMFDEAKGGVEKTRKRPTNYAIEARKMDQARVGDYWSTPHEMAARAFAAYVEDKVSDAGWQSDFIVYRAHGGIILPMIDGFVARPYPEGDERAALKTAFDRFTKELKVKETDKGVALFSTTALPPSARADIPGELTQAFGKLRARVLMRKITVLESQEEAKALVARLGGKLSAAWHGSPHEFDEFRMSAVGTGEGHQAFGWGLYFASRKEVAEWYRETLSGASPVKVEINGKELSFVGDGKREIISELVANGHSKLAAVGAIEKLQEAGNLEDAKAPYLWESVDEQLSEGEQQVKDALLSLNEVQDNGRLYKVELAPQDDEYLDWNKPLDKQSGRVKEALGALPPEVLKRAEANGGDGAAIYRAVADEIGIYGNKKILASLMALVKEGKIGLGGKSDQKASEYLHSLGVRGIKFLDQNSRFGEGDTHNLVVFADSDIEITAKFSKDGAIQGIYANGKTYLVADGIAKNQAVPVLLHELGEHAAQLGFAGDREYQGILRSLEKRAEAQNATGEAIRAAMARVPEDTLPEHYWSEVAAYLVENKANSEIGIVKRILHFFKRWLYKAGAINADRLTPEDLVLFARSATLAHTGATYGEGVRQSVREMLSVRGGNMKRFVSFDEWKPVIGGVVPNPKAGPGRFGEPSYIVVGADRRKTFSVGEVRRFYRAGKIPEGGRSYDFREQFFLNGVSVYPLPEPGSFAGYKEADWYTGYGKVVESGSDGEPVIKPIGEWRKFSPAKSQTRQKDAYNFLKKNYPEELDPTFPYASSQQIKQSERDLFNPVDTNSAALSSDRDESFSLEFLPDSLMGNAEFISNLANTDTFKKHGLGGFDVPSKRIVAERMALVVKDGQVLDSVVEFIPIDVVNILASEQLSPEVLLHDEAMLSDLFSGNSNQSVFFPVDVPTALVSSVALAIAKNKTGSGDLGRFSANRGTAVTTGDKDLPVLGGKVTSVATENFFGVDDMAGAPFEGGPAGETLVDRHNSSPKEVYIKYNKRTKLSTIKNFSSTDPRIRYSKRFEADEAEIVERVKPALRKNDLKWWERIFKTFDYLSRLDPASKRIFQYGSEDRRENKVRLEDRILDDISVPDGAYIDPQYAEKKKAGFVAYLTELQKKDKATYKAANDYLLQVDRTGKAFAIKRQEGYTVTTPDGGNDKKASWIVTDPKGAVLSGHDTENEAVVARREAEAGKMRADGKDEKTIAAVMKFREMTDRAFDLMAGDLRRVIDEAERLGLDEPTMEVVDERKRYVVLDARGNKVPESYCENRKDAELFAKSISHKGRFQVKKQADNEILMPMTLSAAISQMGDLRGSYFPRQRQAGAVVLTATKDGSNIRKNFDLYMLGGERTDIETGEVLTESKIKTFLRDRANRVTPLGLEMARLKADGYTVKVAPADRMPETVFEATQLFASINALIEDAAKGVKKDADPNLQRAYNELAKTLTMNIADTFKQRGYLSSRMKRTQDYWEGFETDMLKAGVQYAKGMAGGLAKREAAQKMTLALTGRETTFAEYQDHNPGAKWEDYQQFVRDNAIDPKKQPRLLEETKSWMKEMLRNDEQADRILGTIKGLAVLKFLGFRVSSAAVNLTNMMQAVPATIAAQTGTSISRALGQVGSSARLYKQYRTGKAEQADKEIFTEISERGWDNPQFNHEAAAVLRSKAGNWFAKFTDAAMWMFGQAEKVNRAVTIHAAYVQAKRMSPDLGHVGWMNKAKQISDDAHGVYGKETAPAWTRGAYNPLKLSYTFQRFMHNYFLNMGQMWERGKYKELTWMLISPALIAGPGATLLTPIAASMLGALGIGGDDPEEEFYTWAEQTFGEGSTGARVARHGFSGALGVNLKGSLEMGFAMPTTVAELFGAPGSLVTDAVDSVRAFGKGEVSKGFEKALPTGMGTMLKANREQREGVTTGGYSPVWYGDEPLKTTGGGSVARFFGFNPSVTSGVREKLWSEKRIEQKYAGERKRINDRIRRLVLQNNGRIPREDMDEIRGEVARYNERALGLSIPGVPLIKASTIRQAIRSAKRPPRKERLRTNPNI